MTRLFLAMIRFLGLTRPALRFFLRLHNVAHRLAAALASRLEPGGLHPKHRLTKYRKWFVERIKPDWTVLDVGCGNGALTADIAAKAKRVVAVDSDPATIAEAEKRHPAENAEYIVADATEGLPDSPNPDAVVLSNVLEHIERRVEFLKSLPGGEGTVFLIRVPMSDREWLVPLKKELGVEWRLDKTHFTEYTEKELRTELEEAGFAVGETRIAFGEILCVAKKR